MDGGSIAWHGKLPNDPDWTEESRLVAYTLSNSKGGGLYIAFNTSHKAQIVQLPQWLNRTWQLISDSGQASLLSHSFSPANIIGIVQADANACMYLP